MLWPGPGARAAIDIDPPSLVKQLSANDLIRIDARLAGKLPRARSRVLHDCLVRTSNSLMFSILNIFNVRVPALSTAAARVVLIRSWTRSRFSRDC